MSPKPRTPDATHVGTHVRLPVELLDAIDQAAEARILGRGKLIELMLVKALEELPPVLLYVPPWSDDDADPGELER